MNKNKLNQELDTELDAIRAIVQVLDPLDIGTREFILDTVYRKLGIKGSEFEPQQHPTEPPHMRSDLDQTSDSHEVFHIKELKNQKRPGSAIEMVALTACWLQFRAPKSDRKDTINSKDAETYFRIAGYKLPKNMDDTLQNDRKAGYLDSEKRGKFRLNPIGYNLVDHSLPRAK